MLKGTTIKYLPARLKGKDEFGAPVYEYPPELAETIEDVLVAPTSANEILTTTDLTGKKAVYTLAIPKEDLHRWENCLVEFFGQTWKPFGIPQEGMSENIPLRWNKKVTVERYE